MAGTAISRAIPQVLLDESDMVVKSGKVVTAGAALGHMDLALWLIRSLSDFLNPGRKSPRFSTGGQRVYRAEVVGLIWVR